MLLIFQFNEVFKSIIIRHFVTHVKLSFEIVINISIAISAERCRVKGGANVAVISSETLLSYWCLFDETSFAHWRPFHNLPCNFFQKCSPNSKISK